MKFSRILNLFPEEYLSLPTLLINNYLVVQTILALEDIGFFLIMRPPRRASAKDLAEELGVDATRLRTCLDFLWVVTDFVRHEEADVYYLTNRNFHHFIYILSAYKDTFDNLAPLLKMEKKFGKDIIRRGYYLKEASDIVTRRSIIDVINSLKDDIQLIDLGCGSALSVMTCCRLNKNNIAVGIDNDSEVVRAGNDAIISENLESRASIILADIREIDAWKRHIDLSKQRVFLASTVFHEFLSSGEKEFVEYLKRFKELFSPARFFILEFDTPSFETLKNEKDKNAKFFFAIYKLWHPFTNQGMPQPMEFWKELIRISGWKLDRVIRGERNLLTYECSF